MSTIRSALKLPLVLQTSMLPLQWDFLWITTLGLRAYSLPDLGSLKEIVRRIASLRFSCPSIWLALRRNPRLAKVEEALLMTAQCSIYGGS